jgi:hypothetical protein
MIPAFLRCLIPERFRPIGYLTDLARRKSGGFVVSGPFAGMRYVATSQGSAYIPKLLGIYERELNPIVEAMVNRRPDLIIDIGAAEGYYAVGLARRLPATRIVAFEMEERGRCALREMAQINGVAERIEVRGRCEPGDLVSLLEVRRETVIVCDVEGYEATLLDPTVIPPLAETAILVELHDFIHPGLRDAIRERFAGTHRIELLTQEPRTKADFPWRTIGTRLLPRSYLGWAVSEWRPVTMEWYWMVPGADA